MRRSNSLNQIVLLTFAFLCIFSLISGVSALSDGSPSDSVTPTQDVVVHEDPDLLNALDLNVTTPTLPVKEISAEVAYVPPYTPEVLPFLNDLDPRTRGNLGDPQFPIQEGLNAPSPGTLPDEMGSTSGSESYVFVTKWGSKGSGDEKFNSPSGVAVDSSGNVYVADTGNDRIQKFSSDGTFIAKWGSARGSGDGQFYWPEGVAVDSSGNVYVADRINNRIQKFSSNGAFIEKWGSIGFGDGQFREPFGVAVDSSGIVYVTDYWNCRIQKFSATGTFIAKWGSEGHGDGQFYYPFGVTVDSSGNVYVADEYNNRIQKFNSSGTFIAKWGTEGYGDGQFNALCGVAVDSSDNVYVVDTSNQRIQKFSPTGLFLTKWGTSGSDDGQFWYPWGVAVDSLGMVYIADTSNNRIQKFALSSANPPVASFIGTPLSGIAPLTVTFTDSSTNTPTNWNWSFGDDSSVNATQQNPVHTYVSNGTYTVSLNATNSAGSNTFTRSNYITVGSGQGLYIFTGQQNGATVYLNPTNTITLKLNDNPSTGNSWNLTTTDGLKITSESFLSSDTTGRLNGAGGIHSWNMSVVGTGEQKISGIYSRSWEPVTGNENRFDMTIIVT